MGLAGLFWRATSAYDGAEATTFSRFALRITYGQSDSFSFKAHPTKGVQVALR